MFNMVIVGTAHMHANEIALYIDRHPQARLCGVADLPAEQPENTQARYTRAWNLQNISESFGVPVYEDYRVMLDEVKPDLTFILCENDRKEEAAAACIERKLPFSLEKPMAVDYPTALRIAQAAEQAGVLAMVNWPVIWRPYVNQFIQAVSQQICGKVIKLEYSNGHTGPLGKGAKHRGVSAQAEEMDDETRARTWWYQKKHGGGVFLDMMCYGSLYSHWILGDAWQGVTAIGLNLSTACCDCADNAAAIVRYADQMAILGGTWTTPNRFMPTGPAAICESGVIWCTRDEEGNPCVRAMDIYANDIEVPSYDQSPCLTDLVCNFIHHQTTGAPLHEPVLLQNNIKMMSLLDAFIRSAESRAEVTP